MAKKRLYRSTKNRMIAGVCGGIAEYFDTDPTVIRLLWAVGSIILGGLGGLFAYLVAYTIIPEK